MANKKVSELTAAAALTGAEITHGVQSGGDVKISASQVLTYVGSNLTKANVGLGNVDNTSDANKPISTATQTALNKKQIIIQFENLTALNFAILDQPGWVLGQNIRVLSEAPNVFRIWNNTDALTAILPNGQTITLDGSTNTITTTSGVPSNGSGLDGDIRIDASNNTYYKKINSEWDSGTSLYPGGSDTAAQILTKIKTVDGSGSGLDADLLDGLNSSDYSIKNDGVFNSFNNFGYRKFLSKIGRFSLINAVGTTESKRGINPECVEYIQWGDSTGALTFYNPASASQNKGVFGPLAAQCSAQDVTTILITSSGDYWAANGSTHPYDYTISYNGIYNQIGVGGSSTWGVGASWDAGNEKFAIFIKENDVSARACNLTLINTSGTVSVNGVNATITVDCSGSELSAVKAGFLYIKYTVNSATGGTYTLTFGGKTTGNITYNATAATVQAALEALDASLSGKVGVSLSGTTYTVLILCNNLPFTWKGLTATVTNLTPTTSSFISFNSFWGSSTGATRLVIDGATADCRFYNPFSVQRAINSFIYWRFARGGLTFSSINLINQNVANVFNQTIDADINTIQEVFGQMSADGTVNGAVSNLENFFAKNGVTYNKGFWITCSFGPDITAGTDALKESAHPLIKAVIESNNGMFVDTWSFCPGWSLVNALGWGGDGIHLSHDYYRACGSIIGRRLGLNDIVGWAIGNRVRTDKIDATTEFNLGLQASDQTQAVIKATTDGANTILQALVANRGIQFKNSIGTVVWQLSADGTSDSILPNFIPQATRVRSTTGAKINSYGAISKTITSANVTLTADEGDSSLFILSGTLTGNRQLIVPHTAGKAFDVWNGTSGAYTITVIGATGTGLTITQGKIGKFMSNGTNIIRVGAELDPSA